MSGRLCGARGRRLWFGLSSRRLLSVQNVAGGLPGLVQGEALGRPVAMYVTGSYCHGGLRPDSDIDLLLITERSLHDGERRHLVQHLLRHSGRRATGRPGRAIELTSLAMHDVIPWRYPAVCDFQYGEWLRTDYESGRVPRREPDPNLPVLISAAREHSQALFGPSLVDLTDPVPGQDLTQSMLDALPALITDLRGDERNVLLTLARMLYTLRTGRIVPKDVAADAVAAELTDRDGHILTLAARAYRGEVADDWTDRQDEAASTTAALTNLITSGRR